MRSERVGLASMGVEARMSHQAPDPQRDRLLESVAFLVLAVGTAILVLVAWAWWRWE